MIDREGPFPVFGLSTIRAETRSIPAPRAFVATSHKRCTRTQPGSPISVGYAIGTSRAADHGLPDPQ